MQNTVRKPKVRSRATKYVVTEWDGTENVVEVLARDVDLDRVTFAYADGLTHTVSLDHFNLDMKASMVN